MRLPRQGPEACPKCQSEAVTVCKAIARQVHGPNARMVFEHAIYKTPFNEGPTPWHQDAAYSRADRGAVAMWALLQDVGADNGCMGFVPGSHLKGLITHTQLASKSNDACSAPTWTVVLTPMRGEILRRVWILNFGAISSVRGFTRSAAKELALRRALQHAR